MSFGYRQIRGHKYGATKSTYNGEAYHSKAEAGHAMWLDQEKREGRIKDWSRQKKFRFFLVKKSCGWVLTDKDVAGKENIHLCDYYLDFVVTHNDKTTELVEVKGMVLGEWKLKWKYLEALYGKNPKYLLTVVKV